MTVLEETPASAAVAPAPYDWSEIEGRAVKRLRGRKIRPVPPAIIRQAQRSYDGQPVIDPETGEAVLERDGSVLMSHALRWEFATPERAVEFAVLMRAAGKHTIPSTSISVKIDPDKTKERPVVNPRVVEWKAGTRKGRNPQV